jgi:protein SCO1/2
MRENLMQQEAKPINKLPLLVAFTFAITLITGISLFIVFSWLLPATAPVTYLDLQEQTLKDGGVTAITPPRSVEDFTLTSHDGQPFVLSEHRGKAIVLFFGYTHCPDVCPLTLHEMARTQSALGPLAESVEFLFISVDGERDTPEWLQTYLGTRGVDTFITGLTGTEGEIRVIGADYGLYFSRNTETSSQAAYLVDHTASSFLIDPDGRLSAIMRFGTEPDTIVDAIKAVL